MSRTLFLSSSSSSFRLLPRFSSSSRRLVSTSAPRPAFATGPSPPRLPPSEQAEYERLQRASTGAFSTPRVVSASNSSSSSSSSSSSNSPGPTTSPPSSSPSASSSSGGSLSFRRSSPPPRVNQSPQSSAATPGAAAAGTATDTEGRPAPGAGAIVSDARVRAAGDGAELHPDVRRGARPEFEGERNPRTGEVGGPKNEPLRWGSDGERGDWSYNGRVTDF